MVRSINHAGAVLLLAVGNVDFDWVEITFQIPLRQKRKYIDLGQPESAAPRPGCSEPD